MSILNEAEELINGERQQQYGNAAESHGRIADLWSAYLGNGIDALTAFDVVNMMVLLKVSRSKGGLIQGQFHRDSYVDIAGYAALGERIHNDFYVGERFGPEQMSLWDEELDDWERELLQVPRIWVSLEDVPTDVRVTDKSGDEWRFDVSHGWQFRGSLTGAFFSMYSNADNHGPFTEILKPEPRAWDSLVDVPTDVKVFDRGGAVWTYKLKAGLGDRWHVYDGIETVFVDDSSTLSFFNTFAPFTEVVE